MSLLAIRNNSLQLKSITYVCVHISKGIKLMYYFSIKYSLNTSEMPSIDAKFC